MGEFSNPESLEALNVSLNQHTCEEWTRQEAEVLEKLIVDWKAENPGIAGEIVFEAGQRPRVQRASPMTLNRAALPTTPKYPATPKALFAQLREMGVGCETCKHIKFVDEIAVKQCEVVTCWPEEDFLCGDWEAGE